MQVNHVQDHITHAIIGQNKAMDFGISDSAEFFNILSSTLYSDQILAVVRETICNAWDAHIEFNCKDIPIEIKLENNELTIRDFGPGIPKDKIQPIYGVYGGSTKKANGQVTGGFGLGCKAPFAYTDHFEVTSWSKHDGEMSIYKMSKSSAEVQGKPSITPIVSVPTIDHGLQVKLAIKKHVDKNRFRELIQRIISNGGINAKFNDSIAEVIDFTKMENNFLIIHKDTVISESNSFIYIRYGNVIYPIDINEKYADKYQEALDLLKRISTNGNHWNNYLDWRLILQAEPDTISVTPSREALSMQDHTIQTVDKLLADFLAIKNEQLNKKCVETTKQAIGNVWINSNPNELLKDVNKIPNLKSYKKIDNDIVGNFDDVSDLYLSKGYPDIDNFNIFDIKTRLNALIQNAFGNNKGLIQTFKAEVIQNGITGKSKWFHQRISTPLIKTLDDDLELSSKKIFLYDHSFVRKNKYQDEPKFVPIKEVVSRELSWFMPLLRNLVIISYNRNDVIERAYNFPMMKFWFGDPDKALVYVTPRNPEKVKLAVEFFKARGMNVLDLTKRGSWEHSLVLEPVTREAAKPRKKGLPRLDCILVNDCIKTSAWLADDSTRIDKPEFVIKIGHRDDRVQLDGFSNHGTRNIIDLFGSKGGVVANVNQEEKYIKDFGAKEFKSYLYEKIKEQLNTNQRIIDWLPFCTTFYGMDYYNYKIDDYKERNSLISYSNWLRIFFKNQDLKEYFGLVDDRTIEDKKYLTILKELGSNYNTDPEYTIITKIINDTKPDAKLLSLVQKIKDSKIIKIFSYSELEAKIQDKNLSDKERELVRDLIFHAIET